MESQKVACLLKVGGTDLGQQLLIPSARQPIAVKHWLINGRILPDKDIFFSSIASLFVSTSVYGFANDSWRGKSIYFCESCNLSFPMFSLQAANRSWLPRGRIPQQIRFPCDPAIHQGHDQAFWSLGLQNENRHRTVHVQRQADPELRRNLQSSTNRQIDRPDSVERSRG